MATPGGDGPLDAGQIVTYLKGEGSFGSFLIPMGAWMPIPTPA